jgi:hypothetical protein
MKYRKKESVEAVQFTNEANPPDGIYREEGRWAGSFSDQSFFNHKYGPIYKYYVKTLEGPLEVKVGDWILTGPRGEHWPCKADIFAETYVAENAPPSDDAVEIIKELLKGGAHDGPCDNEGWEMDDGCSLHVVTARERDNRARRFLSTITKVPNGLV